VGWCPGDRIATRGAGCAAEGRQGPGDPAAQARQVFENLRRCLAQVGAGFGDVVKLTFFVLNVADLPAVRAARDAVIDTAKPPASTAVQVAALFAPGYVLEAEAWALVDD
jgi:enamine deaminase RidA (YjgF/YER057c/UK114 family)